VTFFYTKLLCLGCDLYHVHPTLSDWLRKKHYHMIMWSVRMPSECELPRRICTCKSPTLLLDLPFKKRKKMGDLGGLPCLEAPTQNDVYSVQKLLQVEKHIGNYAFYFYFHVH
jgi:hypothetical protein